MWFGVEFIGKDDKDDNKMIGFIAQDVEKLFSGDHINGENEYKSLAYGNVTEISQAIKNCDKKSKIYVMNYNHTK